MELVAEAYSVDVDVTWPEEGVEGLDFGAFKVVDPNPNPHPNPKPNPNPNPDPNPNPNPDPNPNPNQVVDEQRSEMTLHNNGKYEVGYKVLLRKRPVRDVLSFTPPEGTLAPGATQKLEVASPLKTPYP